MFDREPKDRGEHASQLAAKQNISLIDTEDHKMIETKVNSPSFQQQTDANNSNTVKQLMSYQSVAMGSNRIYQLQSYANESNIVKQLLSFQQQADNSPKSKTLIAHQNLSSRPTQLQTLQLARDDYNNNENRTDAQETAHKHTLMVKQKALEENCISVGCMQIMIKKDQFKVMVQWEPLQKRNWKSQISKNN